MNRAIAVAVLAMLTSPAAAHDDYPWIRDPVFKTATGAHCCSEQHCKPAEAGELSLTPTGWRHNPTQTEITYDKPGIYSTRDPSGRTFRCVMGGHLVCVMEGTGT